MGNFGACAEEGRATQSAGGAMERGGENEERCSGRQNEGNNRRECNALGVLQLNLLTE